MVLRRLFLACSISLSCWQAGCGGSAASLPSDAASDVAPVVVSQTFALSFPAADRFVFSNTYQVVVAFDLRTPSKTATRGPATVFAGYPGLDVGQITLVTSSAVGLNPCLESARSALTADADKTKNAKDPADITTVRIDFEETKNAVSTDPELVCYGVHASGGAWTWTLTTTPLVVDTMDGAFVRFAHVSLSIDAKNIDQIAFASSLAQRPVAKITYVASSVR